MKLRILFPLLTLKNLNLTMLLKEIIERDKNLMAFFHLLSNIKKKKKNEEFLDLGLQCPRKKVLLKVTQFYSSHY